MEAQSMNAITAISAINSGDQWLNVEAQVAELWEPRSDSIAQVGLLADSSGKTKFIVWEASDAPELEEGEAYEFTNVVSEEYDGRYSVQVNSQTSVERIVGEAGQRDNLAVDVSHAAPIETIDNGERWLTLSAEVLQLWEPKSDSMAQVGLLGDGTETIKFVSWKTSDVPELEEGGQYLLEDIVTEEYEGKLSVKLNSETSVSRIVE